ncbi:TonB-dependent receptor [Bowmanella sp. JS7-9]|uniref:Carboxypeptidase regulatory-like domain-containing protein n=2 Tax=Pseudobowmanella zhangzhouensis TaxID=1537679 RepID=A0ABW1XG43_9ALTE|nr:TonB-dependent receptor [Bowmanella sp. JS7-9]
MLGAVIASTLGFSAAVMADTGGLKVRITDANGNPVTNAKVMVSTPESLGSKEATTDAEGFVRLVGLYPSAKYTLVVEGNGYQTLNVDQVKVVSDKTFSLNYVLNSDQVEKIAVTGSRNYAQIDTTSSAVGVDITLDLTESLPTQRSYQSYLQIVPGVKPSPGNNPSSKSGVNYSDIPDARTGSAGSSSDNVYYIDGVNVTDNSSGTFGANFNSEIIQEQQVLTGGIPAKYAGGAGLVSRVITKSGSNDWHGSVNYYFQNDSLVSDYKHEEQEEKTFSNYDTAITLGGPIIEDELWFFASYQVKNEQQDVPDIINGGVARSVERDEKLGFAKITWQATDADLLTLTFFNDPTDISGTTDPNTLNNRDTARKQGGNNFKLDYSHTWDNLILNAGYNSHKSELSDVAANRDTRNNVAFLTGSPSKQDTQLGGDGQDVERHRDKDGFYINAEYFMYTNYGDHTFEVGYEYEENLSSSFQTYTGDGAQYASVNDGDAGITLGDYFGTGWTGSRSISSTDLARIKTAIQNSDDAARYTTLLDTNTDGSISDDELRALQFSSTAGNPTGDVNVYRIVLENASDLRFKSKGHAFYLQDNWTFENLTLTAGVRAEKWSHYASNGEKIFTFDWEYAPRLSVIYDLFGDGESKVWAFNGRYYDPIRTNMTSFAGNFSDTVRNEQVFVDGDWVTFRSRGAGDALFAPTTKTPYTDEIMLGYAQTLGDNMTLSVTYTERETRDILEDYDLGLYAEGGDYAGTGFQLPLHYFGFDEVPRTNYVIGTLEGGVRKYKGYEVTFRKLRSDNWQMLASFTHNDAEGNTNSDSNADFQGDWAALDPRAPNQYGKQPGNIEDQFKIAGSYFFDNGIEVGAVYNWNSGVRYSETWEIYGRHLPYMVETPYEYWGLEDTYIREGAVGSHTTPSYGTLDLRVKYTMDFDQYKAEFFLDVFNALDDQAVVREQDLYDGDGTFDFGDAMGWVEPRRFYLGARLSF